MSPNRDRRAWVLQSREMLSAGQFHPEMAVIDPVDYADVFSDGF